MESVATHPPPLVPTLTERDAFLPAASSRAVPVSDDDIAAASAECAFETQKPRGDSEEGLPNRQQQVAHSDAHFGDSQESRGKSTAFAENAELTTNNATPEACQALDSPTSQVEQSSKPSEAVYRAQVPAGDDDSPPEVNPTANSNGGTETDILPSPKFVQQHIADDRVVVNDVPSPTSSSADAPGSDYDGLDDREQATDLRIPRELQTDRSISAWSAAPSCGVDLNETETTIVRDGSKPESARVPYSVLSGPDVAQVGEQLRQANPASKDDESCDANDRWAVEASPRLDGVENKPATVTWGMASQTADPGRVDATTSHCQQEEDTAVQLQHPSDTLTRTCEEASKPSLKRRKLDDAEAESIPVSAVNAQPEQFATPKAKSAPKEAAEPLFQPKSPSGPVILLKPKSTSKRSSALQEKWPTEAQARESFGTAESAAAMTGPSIDSNSGIVLEKGLASAVNAPAPKTKKARAPPQKRTAKSAKLPEEEPRTLSVPLPAFAPDLSSSSSSLAPGDTRENTAEGSAPRAVAKEKTKVKTPGKAKGKTKVEPLSRPNKGNVPAETAINVSSKSASKRTTAKKAKGSGGKQRVKQAVENVSVLGISVSSFHHDGEHDGEALDNSLNRASKQTWQAPRPSIQGDKREPQTCLTARAPMSGDANVNYASSNIFAPHPPPLYPAQAYYPTRMCGPPQHGRGLSTLTSAASMLESDMQWADSSAARQAPITSEYDGINQATSPATIANTSGSVAGDGASDATSLSPNQSVSKGELDPRLYPRGWRHPVLDLMDPDLLMTTMRERTVWTFWDCYLPLGCRDQDMVLLSNDGIAFPCAAWNPCLFSTLLQQVIRDPSRPIRLILERGPDENRKLLGYTPLPCVKIDENWQAANLLLSFLHPIPTMFLPDRTTCRLVLDIGLRYGVDRAISAATQRMNQLDEELRVAKSRVKGKAKSTEEDIAVDLADRVTGDLAKYD